MPLSVPLPWILTAIVASVAGSVSGIHAGLPALSWAALLIFTAVLIATSVEINRPWWHAPPSPGAEAAASAAHYNTSLLSVAYTWGGLAMFADYRLSGLRWQHGWQYAAIMGVIAGGLMLYVWLLERSDSRLRQPRALSVATQWTMAQAFAAVAGLVFLLLSGKLSSAKSDWAANQIFLSGGLAIVALSAIAAYTQYRLAKPRARHDAMSSEARGHDVTPWSG